MTNHQESDQNGRTTERIESGNFQNSRPSRTYQDSERDLGEYDLEEDPAEEEDWEGEGDDDDAESPAKGGNREGHRYQKDREFDRRGEFENRRPPHREYRSIYHERRNSRGYGREHRGGRYEQQGRSQGPRHNSGGRDFNSHDRQDRRVPFHKYDNRGGQRFRRPTARQVAIRILADFEEKRQPVDRALDQALKGWAPPDRRDAGMVHEIVMGVLRHRRRLDMALRPLCTKPLEELSFDLLAALRIGLYQLYYLDRVPDHAAIKETVSALHPGPGRMANAVLREAQRRGPEILEIAAEDAAEPLRRAALEWSMPDWLLEYLSECFGEDEAVQIAQASHQRPQLVVRANEPTLSRDEVMERLKADGSFPLASPTTLSPLGLRLGPVGMHGSRGDWTFLRDGLACVQDEASQIVGLLMEAKSNERILDYCAAPGGKTTLMAAQMQGQGTVVAVDRTIPKRRKIQQLAHKLGLTNVWVESTPPAEGLWPVAGMLGGPPFDGILIDVPCSGLGTLARRPDIKWLKEREDLDKLADLQLSILERVWGRLRPGGRLVYSTCTVGDIENQDVVERFLETTDDAGLEPISADRFAFLANDLVTEDGYLEILPHRHAMDGMFAARLRKKTTTVKHRT